MDTKPEKKDIEAVVENQKNKSSITNFIKKHKTSIIITSTSIIVGVSIALGYKNKESFSKPTIIHERIYNERAKI